MRFKLGHVLAGFGHLGNVAIRERKVSQEIARSRPAGLVAEVHLKEASRPVLVHQIAEAGLAARSSASLSATESV